MKIILFDDREMIELDLVCLTGGYRHDQTFVLEEKKLQTNLSSNQSKERIEIIFKLISIFNYFLISIIDGQRKCLCSMALVSSLCFFICI